MVSAVFRGVSFATEDPIKLRKTKRTHTSSMLACIETSFIFSISWPKDLNLLLVSNDLYVVLGQNRYAVVVKYARLEAAHPNGKGIPAAHFDLLYVVLLAAILAGI